ncbi:MAG: SDR family oxidoreductase [Deltaproteobacteria bacterium]|nr:SDR family oxidoreductase [Deltaproteobacteria bacterium]
MEKMLEGRVAVVTGAARGIGRGIAMLMAAEGARVVVADYGVQGDGTEPSSEPANEVVAEIVAAGGEAKAVADTVATMAGAARIVGTAVSTWGRIDILVTCAGFLRDRMVFNMAEEDFDAVVGVHLKGTFACARAAVGPMREQGYGRILTFTSGAGLFGNPGQTNYGSAKSAIGGLTKVLARDLGKYGITCNAISPVAGTRMTLTDAYFKAREIRKQQGIVREERGVAAVEDLDPNDVAPLAVYLASEEAGGVNGQMFLATGTSYALIAPPRPVSTIWKEGRWTVDELIATVPETLMLGVANPAPARAEGADSSKGG